MSVLPLLGFDFPPVSWYNGGRKENERKMKMQDQELFEHGEEDYTWCLFVDDEEGNEIFCSGFIFDTEEGAFQEGSLFADEFRISVISDFEQNKINEETQ